jgi:hypothetical protein
MINSSKKNYSEAFIFENNEKINEEKDKPNTVKRSWINNENNKKIINCK